MAIVQVCGCKNDGANAVAALVSNQEAEFYGVYVGEPGAFKHRADRDTLELAMGVAQEVVANGEATEIDDKTFDA